MKARNQMTTADVALMTKSQIMTTAWAVARAAAAKHGGKASEYFAECLRSVWAKVKTARTMCQALIKGSAENLRRVEVAIAAEHKVA